MLIDGPGTLALNCREMHSAGWMPSTRKFCARRSIGVSRNIANGACLNLIATSVTRVSNAFPVRRKNEHSGPPPIIDLKFECRIGLRGAVRPYVGRGAIIFDRIVASVTAGILPAHGI